MRRAVYLSIVLWFARKLLGKVSGGRASAVPATGWLQKRPGEVMLALYGDGWYACIPGSGRSGLTMGEWNRVASAVDREYGGRLLVRAGEDVKVCISFTGETEDEGEIPPGVAEIMDGISRFVREELDKVERGAKP